MNDIYGLLKIQPFLLLKQSLVLKLWHQGAECSVQKLPFLLNVFFKVLVDLVLPLGLLLWLKTCKTGPVRGPANAYSVRDYAVTLFGENRPLLIHYE